MAKVLRFPNSSQGGRNPKTRGRLVRRVMRRTSSFRPRGDRYGVDPGVRQPGARSVPTRVLQQPITRRVTDRSDIDTPGGIAI